MTDAHCHLSSGDPTVRELMIGRDFAGVHPWDAAAADGETLSRLRARLASEPQLGVGEIGLDRLREREISSTMRSLFEAQLQLAAEFGRRVVLHGAKCWGEVVRAADKVKNRVPAFLFHGFSRSAGLIPDIVKLNGYISVGPAVLNDHAVNYRELVRQLPLERLLVETDRTVADSPTIREVLTAVASVRGLSPAELELITDANAVKFWGQAPRFVGTGPATCGDRPRDLWGQAPQLVGTGPEGYARKVRKTDKKEKLC